MIGDPTAFRAALLAVSELSRDAWVDAVLGIGELPDDGDDLPRDGVPYLPCPVDAILRAVDAANVRADDVLVDVGSGVGRAAALVHLLTGARVIGIEVQRGLVEASRAMLQRLGEVPVSIVEGDATELVARMSDATVFFLYCPFGAARVAALLARMEPLSRTRALRIATIDLPLPETPWLVQEHASRELAVFRSR